MARSKADQKKKEATPEEPEYVIEEILAHKRKGADLKYKIKWEGYDDITWEPEDNVPDGPAVEKYWKKSVKPLDRYAPGSKQYRAAKKEADEETKASKATKSKKRASNASDDEDDEQEGKAKKRGRKSATNGSPVKKGGKKPAAKEEEEAEDDEKEMDAEPHGNGYEVDEDREMLQDWEEAYGSKESWEEDVKTLETIHQEDENMTITVVWKDDRASVVDLDVARARCPQHVINFFISHLKFKPAAEVEENDVAEE
ncbi:hypothetical protein JCM10450v2_005236 [Rhodotorula kratochvilovae]